MYSPKKMLSARGAGVEDGRLDAHVVGAGLEDVVGLDLDRQVDVVDRRGQAEAEGWRHGARVDEVEQVVDAGGAQDRRPAVAAVVDDGERRVVGGVLDVDRRSPTPRSCRARGPGLPRSRSASMIWPPNWPMPNRLRWMSCTTTRMRSFCEQVVAGAAAADRPLTQSAAALVICTAAAVVPLGPEPYSTVIIASSPSE